MSVISFTFPPQKSEIRLIDMIHMTHKNPHQVLSTVCVCVIKEHEHSYVAL